MPRKITDIPNAQQQLAGLTEMREEVILELKTVIKEHGIVHHEADDLRAELQRVTDVIRTLQVKLWLVTKKGRKVPCPCCGQLVYPDEIKINGLSRD